MKAISLKQPWADLVVQGKKTLELRTWKVAYRGKLAIHASMQVDKPACEAFGIQTDTLTVGAVVGEVDLVGINELTKEQFDTLQTKHLANDLFLFTEPMYGWKMENPIPYQTPKPVHGRMGLFNFLPNINTEPDRKNKRTETEQKLSVFGPAEIGKDTRFELRIIPEESKPTINLPYRLAIIHRNFPQILNEESTGSLNDFAVQVVELGGSVLKAIADQILDALRVNGYKVTDLSANRKEPFTLCEESGVRLSLLFLAIKPIAKMNRVEEISSGLRAMTSEEAYYWYSKCTVGNGTGIRAQKALRLMLSVE